MRAWWEERALPRLVDVALSDATARRWRELVCSGAAGRVLEVGFGSGRNLAYLPDAVSEVLAVEPADLAWERAAARVGEFGRPVWRVGLDGAALPVEDNAVDVVISTWVMCTIPDLDSAIREMRRVLRPGGTIRYVEHVRSPHPRARRIQERLQPFWGAVSGGCHLERDIEASLRDAGLGITALSPPPDAARFELAPFVAGVASASPPQSDTSAPAPE